MLKNYQVNQKHLQHPFLTKYPLVISFYKLQQSSAIEYITETTSTSILLWLCSISLACKSKIQIMRASKLYLNILEWDQCTAYQPESSGNLVCFILTRNFNFNSPYFLQNMSRDMRVKVTCKMPAFSWDTCRRIYK